MAEVAFTLAEAAVWMGIGGSVPQGAVAGVSTDTRTLEAGNLFIALRGPRHDGHDHAVEAAARGAAALLVERRLPVDLPQLVVADTRLALGRLAAGWRSVCSARIIGITGSNGKTTVKEMTAAILARMGATLATRGNLNNDIGMPLTLLQLTPEHRFGVIEMGANHPGEIAYLSAIATPDVALITNAGPAHLEGFGSTEGVARAKGEIYGGLKAEGTAIINADDPYAPLWDDRVAARRVLHFGQASGADVQAQWEPADFGTLVRLRLPSGEASIRLGLAGRHNVMNALAAATAAFAAGATLEAICSGLESVQPVSGRLQPLAGPSGARLIDDSYNANPASVRSGIEVLAAYPGQRILVLGDMGELGPDTPALHAEVGAAARAAGVDHLYATGHHSRLAAESFGANGIFFSTQEELVAALRALLGQETTVLIKGSRSARMDRVVAALAVGGGIESCFCM